MGREQESQQTKNPNFICITDQIKILPAGLSSFPAKLTSTAELTTISLVPFSAPMGSSKAGGNTQI